MSDEKEPKPDIFTHEPLPYVVVVRAATDDDSLIESTTHRVVAYSMLEAMLQATVAAGGTAMDQSIKVESVAPDVEAYLQMVRKRTIDRLKATH